MNVSSLYFFSLNKIQIKAMLQTFYVDLSHIYDEKNETLGMSICVGDEFMCYLNCSVFLGHIFKEKKARIIVYTVLF